MLLFSPDPKSGAESVTSLLDFQGSSGGAGHTGERETTQERGFICCNWEVWQCCPLELSNDGTSEICILAPLVLRVVR